jgi:hypothetical protein
VAIALGNQLDVGTMEEDELKFELPDLIHNTSVIIGRRKALDWCRHYLAEPIEVHKKEES